MIEQLYRQPGDYSVSATLEKYGRFIRYLHRRKPVDGGAMERIVSDAIIDIKTIPDTTPASTGAVKKEIYDKDGGKALNSKTRHYYDICELLRTDEVKSLLRNKCVLFSLF